LSTYEGVESCHNVNLMPGKTNHRIVSGGVRLQKKA
jgi:hypothetical protein